MKKERYAALLILLAFFSGMVLTAATSGCDARSETEMTAQVAPVESTVPSDNSVLGN